MGMCISQLLRRLLDEALPRSCAFCGVIRQGVERNLCADCLDELPRVPSVRAPASSLLTYTLAPLRYEFPVDAAIKAFKFQRKLFYAPAFAEILCDSCEQLPPDIDAVVPVPLHWRRKMMRGFNQSLELARPVAKQLMVPVLGCVYRRQATPYQSGLAATERERNLRHAFAARYAPEYDHVLIIDDVITTGATGRSLARVLLAAGVARVSMLAIARVC